MNKVLVVLILGGLGAFAWQRAQRPAPAPPVADRLVEQEAPASPSAAVPGESAYRCDGRVYCSEMKC